MPLFPEPSAQVRQVAAGVHAAGVFEGRRELFEQFTLDDGTVQPRLFIATTGWKWEQHPVLRFDFSKCEEYTADGLKVQIDNTLAQYERKYGLTPYVDERSIRLENIILAAHEQTGRGSGDTCR